jgi:hypothetical protein
MINSYRRTLSNGSVRWDTFAKWEGEMNRREFVALAATRADA